MALCIAALITPYCFAPRPFAYAVIRPVPFLVAVVTAGAGAILAKVGYAAAARSASLALGVQMTNTQPDRWLAVYLLAVLTLAWTLASCAIAPSEARRGVGAGLALIVLGGYAFKWPHHYLLPLLGVAFIADAARRVRDEELAALPMTVEAPPIGDTIWSTYVGTVAQGLRAHAGRRPHADHARRGGPHVERDRRRCGRAPVRARIERIDGCVLGLDVVLGRDIDEVRAATLTVWAIPARGLGVNLQGPPAAPALFSGDPHFEEWFRRAAARRCFARCSTRAARPRGGDARRLARVLGARGAALPRLSGRGAPLDHPMPLSDLALGRIPPTAERLVADRAAGRDRGPRRRAGAAERADGAGRGRGGRADGARCGRSGRAGSRRGGGRRGGGRRAGGSPSRRSRQRRMPRRWPPR